MRKNYSDNRKRVEAWNTIITTLLLIGCPILLFGQGNGRPAPPLSNSVVPPAPTAAALGKFADIPVGLYTGKPQITIPLWTVIAGKLALPISLDYNAGGIKVEEIASWVGLGWSLNAGGVITRAMRGVPDEGVPGAYGAWGLYNQYTIRPNGGYTQADHSQFYDYATGKADSQPDLYYFNFNGKSGKFVTTNSQQAVQLTPYQNLQVQPLATGWKIIAEDGTRYEFLHAESSTYSSISYATHGRFSGTSSPEPQRYTSSWFLSRVISAANDTITLKYSDYNLPTYSIASSETKYARLNPPTNTHEVATTVADNYTVNAMTLEHGKRLRRIEFANGAVDFLVGAGRCDLPGDSVLAQIIVRQRRPGTAALAIVKTFSLEQRYLQSGYLSAPLQLPGCSPTPDPLGQNLDYRPLLTAVTERSGTLSKPPYQFEYILNSRQDGKSLPYRAPVANSTGNLAAQGYYAQDHWGYYNGQNTNTTLVPPLKTAYVTSEPLKLPGANRSPDLAYARIGSLTNITYPTGGSTSFEWELHDFVPPHDLRLTPPTYDRTWSYSTRLAGSTLEPFVINDEVNHEALVSIQIDNRFPCACLGDDSFYDACGVYTNCRVWFKIINDDTGASPYIYSALAGTGKTPSPSPPTSTIITLPNGHYHVEHHHEITDRLHNSRPTEYAPDPAMPYGMTMTWQETINVPFDQGGGLRIAKMVDYDPVAQQRTTKTYDYRQSGITSGTLIAVPRYTYPFQEDIRLVAI